MDRKNLVNTLKRRSLELRIDVLRATTSSGSGHPTSCLSAADIIAVLFFHFMRYDTQNPDNQNNDRCILSKGHAIPLIYAAWKQIGVITDSELLKLRTFHSVLEGHPTPRFAYNEAATGSLGQGISIACGMCHTAKKNNLSYRTFFMLGDGESAEGSVWESAAFASHYNLNNLIGITDANRLGQSGESIDDHHITTMKKKWESFGWQTYTVNGHNHEELIDTFDCALQADAPVMVIAQTYKGYGLDDIEDKNGYHGKPFSSKELEDRIIQLKKRFSFHNTSLPLHTMEPPSKSTQEKDHQQIQSFDLNLASDPHTTLFEKGSSLATRKAFGYALAYLGHFLPEIHVLDADVKNSTFTELFEQAFPDRFTQCFVAEQTMIGVAVGMQLRGLIPFAATFAAFHTRAYDQIRMAAIGRVALRLCGSHAGVSIGEDGPSQMGLEDLALMRALPSSIVLYPSDAVAAYKLVGIMASYNDGISYLRTTRASTNILYDKDETFHIGGSKIIRQSNDDQACIVAAGITLHEALKAHDILAQENIHVAIIDAYSIKPLDTSTIRSVAQKSGNRIITVEDHYKAGGLGEAVASALVNDTFTIHTLYVDKLSRSGTPAELLAYAGIDADAIVKEVKKALTR